MRTRAYRPEAPTSLEERSLPSGFAVRPAHPVVLLNRQLDFVIDRMRDGFQSFTRYRDISQLRTELDDVVLLIPFERVDGLDVSIGRIVDRMQQEIFAHVPGAVRSASNEVVAVTRADVQARVRAGDVVVR